MPGILCTLFYLPLGAFLRGRHYSSNFPKETRLSNQWKSSRLLRAEPGFGLGSGLSHTYHCTKHLLQEGSQGSAEGYLGNLMAFIMKPHVFPEAEARKR